MTGLAVAPKSASFGNNGTKLSSGEPEWKALLERAKKAMAEGRERTMPPSSIRRMENQPRKFFSSEGLERLATSLKAIGQIFPGIVRPVEKIGEIEYELVDGERRWRSSMLAGTLYKAIVIEVDDEAAAFIIAAVANFNREGHTPTEVSDSIEAMRNLKIPMEEIAKMLGISLFWAIQMHGLQKLDPRVREMLHPELPKDQRLQISAAVQIAKIDQQHQHSLALRVLRSEVSLKGLRDEAVKISRLSGTYVRTHKRAPARQWESARSLTNWILRTSQDLELRLRENGMDQTLVNRDPSEVKKLKRSLEQTTAILKTCSDLLQISK
jgi:ParB/RepB/Spo0J family partition protein